jgi:hypothetical protein
MQTDGWSTEPVLTLGEREPMGGEHFRLGYAPQVRAIALDDQRDALLTVNEVGDVLAYESAGTSPCAIPLLYLHDASYRPLGRSAFPGPEHYKYAAALPRGDGDCDLLLSFAQFEQLYLLRRRREAGVLHVGPRELIGKAAGVIDVIDWRGDGRHDLLLGTRDGRLLRLPRKAGDSVAFDESAPQPVSNDDGPITGAGPLCPNVVDLPGRGNFRGRDLLVGDGDGCVTLYLDLGGESKEPRYDRGRVLATVEGPASATVLREAGRRWLIVADGQGALWRWELAMTTSLVQREWQGLPEGWRVTRDEQGALLTAAPQSTPPRRFEEEGRAYVAKLDPPAATLTLPLPARGWHELHLTLRRPAGTDWDSRAVVKLSDSPAWQVVVGRDRHREARQAVFLGCVNLTGQSLQVRQLVGALHVEGGYPCWIESLRLTPVSPPTVVESNQPHMTTAAIFDAFMWNNHVATGSESDIDDMIAFHRRGGFDILYYKMGGACWEYPSSVPGADSIDPVPFAEFSDEDRAYCSRVKRMWESYDRFGQSIRACHRHGMRCFGWIRLQNENEHFHGKYPISRFYAEHPQWLEKDINGDAVRGKLCLGYPEVRRFYVELVLEAMHKGADGILLDTMRHLPKVMYGDAIVAMFRAEHGLDMRQLPPMDSRVMALQCRVMGDFLGELREAMGSVKPDAPLHVRICKPYALMGVDPAGWAKRGLVDAFIIEDRVGARRPDLAGLCSALREAPGCRAGYAFTRAFWGRTRDPLTPRRIAGEVQWARQQGVALMAFYESAEIVEHPEMCRAIRAINDPTQQASRVLVE